MKNSSVRPTDDIEKLLNKYGDMLFRICMVILGDSHDAEDVIQDTMMKYWRKAPCFRDENHEKAWLIAVTSNGCRDLLRYRKRHQSESLDNIEQAEQKTEGSGILEALQKLPEKYRLVLTLHYVEGYRVEEIANMIGKSSSAIKMRLQKGRRLLEEVYRKEYM